MFTVGDVLKHKDNTMHLKAARNNLVEVLRNTSDENDYDSVKMLIEKIDILIEYGRW